MAENDVSSSPSIKCYELITDDLVKEALENDKGKGAELVSWETREFTNPGDNYASIVTSILVKYKENNSNAEETYVVKLNPLRPQSSFTDIMEDTYAKETIILTSIISGMSKQLNRVSLPPIKSPKLLARNLEKGREAFVTENLRKQGFLMHDRKKGMDVIHALLVLEELGRFHASSLLFEETLFPKTIPESFEYMQDPTEEHMAFKIFESMIKTQTKNACIFLKNLPKYEKCFKWLNANIDNMSKYYLEANTKFKKTFEVLIHGDCWTNNILFKYNEQNVPVDVRFVDLQVSRKSTIVSEILYFFYTSLSGDARVNNFQLMLYTYYQSFSKVLIFSRKKVPFTFKELLDETEKNKILGLISGMLLIPGVVAEGDELFDLSLISDDRLDEFEESFQIKFAKVAERGPFKDRFLSMFDEMMDSHVFDD